MVKKNIIEPAQTAWAALIVFLLEKEEPLQFFVHCRKLNTETKRRLYLKARTDKYFYSLHKAAVFLMLDANRSSWQIDINDADNGMMWFD